MFSKLVTAALLGLASGEAIQQYVQDEYLPEFRSKINGGSSTTGVYAYGFKPLPITLVRADRAECTSANECEVKQEDYDSGLETGLKFEILSGLKVCVEKDGDDADID